MKTEILRGTLVMYEGKKWSIVKVRNEKEVEIWRNSDRAIVSLSELRIIG